MIAKRIDRKVKNDNYRALALYVGGYAEKNPDEKVLHNWIAGCAAETYLDALLEIEAVQTLNTRTNKEKTYHLMLSFRPEDEANITPELMEIMETRFAEALGFAEHQRHCGAHKNTNNMHLHIAYNMIHPETFNRHEPFGDFYKIAAVCRELEQRYGLIVDNGPERKQGQEPVRGNIKAQTMEAHSGQESFDSYIKNRRGILLDKLDLATDWQAVHSALALHGIGIKSANNGLCLYNLHGKEHAKASSLSRTISKPNLEKRFGEFEAAGPMKLDELEQYSKKPLQHEPNRENLYSSYQAACEKKNEAWAKYEQLKAEEEFKKKELLADWKAKRKEIQLNHNLTKKDRWELMQQTYTLQKEQLLALAEPRKEQREKIKQKFPFKSWNDYLKIKTLQGNETALAILRDKKIKPLAGEVQIEPKHSEIKNQIDKQKQELLQNKLLTTKDKKKLLAVLKLKEKPGGHEIKLDISSSGVLIISLPSGGSIRDTGKQIYFSTFDPEAEKMAQEYAKIRFGKMYKMEKNVISFNQYIPRRNIRMER